MSGFEDKIRKEPHSFKASCFHGASGFLQFGEGIGEWVFRIADWSDTRSRVKPSRVLQVAIPPNGTLSDLMNLISERLNGPDLSRRPICQRLEICSLLIKKRRITGLVFKQYPKLEDRFTRSQLLDREQYHQFLKIMADRGLWLFRDDGTFRSFRRGSHLRSV